jgi:hypothetical protein
VLSPMVWILLTPTRKGRIRRGHGLRPLRLMLRLLSFFALYTDTSDYVAHVRRTELKQRGLERHRKRRGYDAEGGNPRRRDTRPGEELVNYEAECH